MGVHTLPDHRRLFEVVDVELHGLQRALAPGAAALAGLDLPALLLALGRPAAAEGLAEQASGLAGAFAVAQHEEAEGLPVGARGRTRCVPEDGVEVLFRDRVRVVPTDRARRREAFEQADGVGGGLGFGAQEVLPEGQVLR